MAAPRRLVLFVEGQGDRDAVPILVKRLLTDVGAWSDVFLDPAPFIVGNAADLTANEGREWLRFLNAARKRPNLGAVLSVQDGDLGRIRGEEFCAARFGPRLAHLARNAGAGSVFSLAVVFPCQEYESWVLACAERLAGVKLPDGRPGIRPGTKAPSGDIEETPRDAKGWLNDRIDAGYQPTRDQGLITRLMLDHLAAIREREMRSFRRLEHALQQLVGAVRDNAHTVSPG